MLFQDIIERESCDSGGEGREDPFRVTGALPRLIQRFQRSGTRTLVSRDLMFGYGTVPIGLSEKYMGPH